LARHETNFEAAHEIRLSRRDPLSLRSATDESGELPTRADALACFLSGGEGWDKAARSLAGAFADGSAVKTNKD
jgi:hypothetical protein